MYYIFNRSYILFIKLINILMNILKYIYFNYIIYNHKKFNKQIWHANGFEIVIHPLNLPL